MLLAPVGKFLEPTERTKCLERYSQLKVYLDIRVTLV